MNINLLRTPEGLNKYLNEEVKTLSVKLPDFMLQMFLWQKVKNDFLITDEKVENLFEDNNKHLLVIKTDEVATKLMIGYLHIQDDIHISSSNYSTVISNKAKELVNELSSLTIKNKWNDNQIFIISTFRLSSYDKIELEQFPNNAKYLYLTDLADQKDRYYEIALDKKTNEFMEGDIMLNYLLERGKKMNSLPEYWSCQICGGNNDTGCLYFDPTECPKFT